MSRPPPVPVSTRTHDPPGVGQPMSFPSEDKCNMLIRTIPHWLPRLSDQLTYAHRTYPVLVHGIPATFDTSHDSQDVATLLSRNMNIITHPSALQHTEFLSCAQTQDQSLHKACHSLILLVF